MKKGVRTMKITVKEKTTTIEATAEELRQGNTLADGFSRLMRGVFNGCISDDSDEDEQEEGENNGGQKG